MIGDVLMSTILLDLIRERYPETELHYLINSHTFPVVENHPNVDKYVFFSPDMEKNYITLFKFLNKIKLENYDAVVDVYGKLSSKLITFWSGAKLRIAYHKSLTSSIYSHAIRRSKVPTQGTSLAIENRVKLLEPLKIEFKNYTPKIYLTPEENNHALVFLTDHHLDLKKPIFMISVLGSSPNKSYPPAYMAALLDIIVGTVSNAQIIFNYIPSQKEKAEAILTLCEPATKNNIYFECYAGSLREFIAITNHCTALIGNEGGAVNIAKALGIPTFIIFSPHLNKQNWFHQDSNSDNIAVHLSDFIDHGKKQVIDAKKNPSHYYQKFKPTFIRPKLISFLNNL